MKKILIAGGILIALIFAFEFGDFFGWRRGLNEAEEIARVPDNEPPAVLAARLTELNTRLERIVDIATAAMTARVFQIGLASWYGEEFHGRPTASLEPFDFRAYTAAHKTLPFQSIIYVLNPENGRTCMARINDRGPFIEGRVLDVSRAVAAELGMIEKGVIPVYFAILNPKLKGVTDGIGKPGTGD